MELLLGLLIYGCVAAFLMSYGLGANDIGNTLGTAVGSGALSINQACAIGGVFELVGAVLLGAAISTTLREGVVDPDYFQDNWTELAIGFFASMWGASLWLLWATIKALPVSTTHSIVAGIFGFGIVSSIDAVNQTKLITIVASWVVSPVVGSLAGFVWYYIIYKTIISAKKPMSASLYTVPLHYGATVLVMSVFILTKGLKNLGLGITFELAIILSFALTILTIIIAYLIVVPTQKKKFKKFEEEKVEPLALQMMTEYENSINDAVVASDASPVPTTPTDEEMNKTNSKEDLAPVLPVSEMTAEQREAKMEEFRRTVRTDMAETLFVPLLVLSAVVLTFSHGANNVSNGVGPLDSIYSIYKNGMLLTGDDADPMPLWILGLGGFGIVVGLLTMGYKVMETIGTRIVKVTYTRGYVAQVATSFVVLLCTYFGLPVSSTHVVLGAVVGVGLVTDKNALKMDLLIKIGAGWVITIPAGAIGSILCFYLTKGAVLDHQDCSK
eukprot:TRINITY_DN4246_c0_g1_i1.p1 TRINITY_DN4246_c0_g1~~TRINITY_DN4246_c0_g1_i1.p1  ORF type:complete len:499 (-),score=172.65 TRINITY_DN4246_c0_g1_i1:32-1528(-)